jgi:hypothetical protein
LVPPGKHPRLRGIDPIGHLETLSKPKFGKLYNVFEHLFGLGGFDAHVRGALIIRCDLLAMILVTHGPLEGVLVVFAGLFPVDKYS